MHEKKEVYFIWKCLKLQLKQQIEEYLNNNDAIDETVKDQVNQDITKITQNMGPFSESTRNVLARIQKNLDIQD